MTSYLGLFITALPVFLLVAVGVGIRRVGWIKPEAEESLFALVVKVLTPCLIFESVVRNADLRQPGNLLLAPLMGFVLTLIGIAVAYLCGRMIGLHVGSGLRTFALTAGIANYGYLPLPIMESLFGIESRGLLLVHNVGVEAAIWTGGVLVVSGISLRDGWKRLLNWPLLALVTGLVVNLAGWSDNVPEVLMKAIKPLAACAIPLGIVLSGISVEPHLERPAKLFTPRIGFGAVMVRLAIMPVIFIAIAYFGPFSIELKRIIVVQGAMPTAMISIIIARVYGGQAFVAAQIILLTTIVAMFTIPFWIKTGLDLLGAR